MEQHASGETYIEQFKLQHDELNKEYERIGYATKNGCLISRIATKFDTLFLGCLLKFECQLNTLF